MPEPTRFAHTSLTSTPERRADIHCHCLPGVDDGPASLEEAVALARMLVHDGFSDVIATPHQLGRYESTNLAPDIRSAVVRFQRVLDEKQVRLKVHAGGEVRVDERIPRLLERDQILPLGATRRYLLLELSFAAYIEPQGLLAYLSGTNLGIILAHAERYATLQRDPGAAEAWLAGGAALQVNAESLVGGAGSAAAATAWELLSRGWVSVLATDAHGTTSRRPRMTEARNLVRAKLGEDLARRVCVENPLVVLDGRTLPPLPLGQRETT